MRDKKKSKLTHRWFTNSQYSAHRRFKDISEILQLYSNKLFSPLQSSLILHAFGLFLTLFLSLQDRSWWSTVPGAKTSIYGLSFLEIWSVGCSSNTSSWRGRQYKFTKLIFHIANHEMNGQMHFCPHILDNLIYLQLFTIIILAWKAWKF